MRLNLAARSAVADHPHQEIAETVIEPLDVSEYAHGRIDAIGDFAYVSRARFDRSLTQRSNPRNWNDPQNKDRIASGPTAPLHAFDRLAKHYLCETAAALLQGDF